MNRIQLVAVGPVELGLLDRLSAALARVYGVSCHVLQQPLEAGFAFDASRNQYHSTAILKALQPYATVPGTRVLAVTEMDLFVPILTFVFGEAQLAGPCAVVSVHRLREEFYGLPQDPKTVMTRLVKEAIHELGHTFGLRHCSDWRCAMASTHSVERLDLKEPSYCINCRGAMLE